MASSDMIAQIKSDEGLLLTAKTLKVKGADEELSIGYGFNLGNPTANESLIQAGISSKDIPSVRAGKMQITKEQADSLFEISLQQAESDATKAFSIPKNAPQSVKDVLTNMSYQMGLTKINKFKDMKRAVSSSDWKGMKREMLDSEWAKQTPKRAKRLTGRIDKIKVEEPPKTAVGQQRSAKELRATDLRNTRATEMAKVMNRQSMIKQLAASMSKLEAKKKEDQSTGATE